MDFIGGKEIGENKYPFIVAEVSCNHEGSEDKAKKLIDAAKSSGADAVKIQIYTPDEMTVNLRHDDFTIKSGPWVGNTLYGLYTKTQTDFNLAKTMFDYAKEIDIPIFASVFGDHSLIIAEGLDCPAYKIASFELTDVGLIKKVALKGKPVVLSTGAADLSEIDLAFSNCDPLKTAIMHCVSAYPTPREKANLFRIKELKNVFSVPIGYSDHTFGVQSAYLAVALGACIIEKHLMLQGSKSEDATFSVYPDEFKTLTQMCKRAIDSCIVVSVSEEEGARQFKRSIYAIKDIKKGENFTKDNVRVIRPGYGLKPVHLTNVLSTYARMDIAEGQPLKEEHYHD